MAFVNAIFPSPKLIHDTQVSTSNPSTVVGNNLTEFRITKLRNHRKQWNFPSRAMLSADRQVLERFVQDTARYSQNSFKFRAPGNNHWHLVQLQYAGTGNYFKLTERGYDDHPIYHLDSDVTVRLNGNPVSYTQAIVGGIPVIAVQGATANSVVTITGGYFYAVRLNQADFSYGMTALDSNNNPLADTIGDVGLIEVFEYDIGQWA